MMTRKDFEKFAKYMHSCKPDEKQTSAYYQWCIDVDSVISVCLDSNPRFDRYKFTKACKEGLK